MAVRRQPLDGCFARAEDAFVIDVPTLVRILNYFAGKLAVNRSTEAVHRGLLSGPTKRGEAPTEYLRGI